jgi:light-regulated signal transduction histidine kinase (bacteriophytochrome)
MSIDEKYLQTVMRTLAHDMGGALRAASGFSKLLAEQYGEQLDEKALQWLSLIRTEGDKAQQQLKMFSRYAKLHGVDGLSAACDLNDALQSAQNEPALRSMLSSCSWLTIKASSLPEVTGSTVMWQLYFAEILSNIASYASSGDPVVCSIYMKTMSDRQVLVIEDDGPGLSMDDVTKAMQPYRSLYSPEKKDSVITHAGMGLSLAKRVVDMHQGQFVVCARPDGFSGLRVEARLPL